MRVVLLRSPGARRNILWYRSATTGRTTIVSISDAAKTAWLALDGVLEKSGTKFRQAASYMRSGRSVGVRMKKFYRLQMMDGMVVSRLTMHLRFRVKWWGVQRETNSVTLTVIGIVNSSV